MDRKVALEIVSSEVEGRTLSWLRVGKWIAWCLGAGVAIPPAATIFLLFGGSAIFPPGEYRSAPWLSWMDYVPTRSAKAWVIAIGGFLAFGVIAGIATVVARSGKRLALNAATFMTPHWASRAAQRLGIDPAEAQKKVGVAVRHAREDESRD